MWRDSHAKNHHRTEAANFIAENKIRLSGMLA